MCDFNYPLYNTQITILKYYSDYCIINNIGKVNEALKIRERLKSKYLPKVLLNKIIEYIPKDTCKDIIDKTKNMFVYNYKNEKGEKIDCTRYCIQLQNNTNDVIIYNINEKNRDIKELKEIYNNITKKNIVDDNRLQQKLNTLIRNVFSMKGLPLELNKKIKSKVIVLLDTKYDTTNQVTIQNGMKNGYEIIRNYFYKTGDKDVILLWKDDKIIKVIKGIFFNKVFLVSGKLKLPHSEIHRVIAMNGGKIAKSLTKDLDYIISDKKYKNTDRQVRTFQWFEDSIKQNKILNDTKYIIQN